MKRIILALVLVAASAFAGAPKVYQVTGRILEIGTDVIVIQKGNEKWEIARDPSLGNDIRLGQRITVHYSMAAKALVAAPEVAPAAQAKHAQAVRAHK